MSEELINADFSERVVVRSGEMPWKASPQAGVERRMLDRIGGEVARATTIVRYTPNSVFPSHTHAMGEEYLVLAGEFGDEHGVYPVGTYVRNPPGSKHAPRVGPGCVIFVKLRQMPKEETERVVIDTEAAVWPAPDASGLARLELYEAAETGEWVALEKLEPGASLPEETVDGGEEILVLAGELKEGGETHGPEVWIRNPVGGRRSLSSETGAIYWVKRGHLAGL